MATPTQVTRIGLMQMVWKYLVPYLWVLILCLITVKVPNSKYRVHC